MPDYDPTLEFYNGIASRELAMRFNQSANTAPVPPAHNCKPLTAERAAGKPSMRSQLQAGDFSKKIGRRIRWLREIQDLTLNDVQTRSGVTGKTLQRYERGGITIPSNAIEAVASALNVSPTRLCGPLDDFSQLVREKIGQIEAPLCAPTCKP